MVMDFGKVAVIHGCFAFGSVYCTTVNKGKTNRTC